LTRALSQLGADIISSSNFTEKGVAIDRFLITDCNGNKITEPERLKAIEASLHEAIEALKQRIAEVRGGDNYLLRPEIS